MVEIDIPCLFQLFVGGMSVIFIEFLFCDTDSHPNHLVRIKPSVEAHGTGGITRAEQVLHIYPRALVHIEPDGK